MTVQVIMTQCVCVAFTIYISRTQKLNRVYIATFLANVAYMLMYLANSDRMTMLSCGFITIRSFIYIFKPQIQKVRVLVYIVPIVMIGIQITIGVLNIESSWQILPIIGGSWTCFFMWFFNTTQHLRIGNATCNTIWLIYDIHGSLFIVVIGRAIMVATNVIAYIQHLNDTESKNKNESNILE